MTEIETNSNNKITSWKSTGLSREKIINPYESDTKFSPVYDSWYGLLRVIGICLKQKIVSFLHKKVVNLYISYTLDKWSKDLSTDFTLGNCLFGAVKLTKNVNLDKYEYSGYSIGFDSRSQILWTDGSYRKNVIIFGVDNSSSVHIDGRNKNILVLGEGPTQGLEDATITAEAKYPINFTESEKRFVLSLHYNGSNSFLFVNNVKNMSMWSKGFRNKTTSIMFRFHFW